LTFGKLTKQHGYQVCPAGGRYEYSRIVNCEVLNTDFTVYPNPTSDYLFINFKNGNENSVVIKDVMGREVSKLNCYAETNKVNVSSLSNGTYFLTVDNIVKKI
jgi:hypothetical protein